MARFVARAAIRGLAKPKSRSRSRSRSQSRSRSLFSKDKDESEDEKSSGSKMSLFKRRKSKGKGKKKGMSEEKKKKLEKKLKAKHSGSEDSDSDNESIRLNPKSESSTPKSETSVKSRTTAGSGRGSSGSESELSGIKGEDDYGSPLHKIRRTAKPEGTTLWDQLGEISGNVNMDKKQVLQVYIRVIEARDLMGNALNPFCKVSLDSKSNKTRIRRGTNNPVFNQSLHFQINNSIGNLHEKQLEFKILSYRRMRQDALVGFHTCDAGLIYRLPDHCLANKWLALVLEDGIEIRGYLKVWICIVGEGDRAPSYTARPSESEDIEDNVLYPAAAQFKTITMYCRVISGEDISTVKPSKIKAMTRRIKVRKATDIHKQDMVNPRVNASIAGQKLKTSAQYFDSNPHFNQELRYSLKWPTVGKFLTFRVFDWYGGLNKAEPIGTAFLNLFGASKGGQMGFLPTFGPAFVSLYGDYFIKNASVRRRTNKGRLPGTAFQGRILVEIGTIDLETYEQEEEEAEGETILQVLEMNDYLVEETVSKIDFERHALFCSFVSGNMLPATFKNNRIHFQVSMGYYGDSGRIRTIANVIAQTESSKPIIDTDANVPIHGCYMPWTNRKPCCVIPCTWEIQHWRYEASNFFVNGANILSKAIEKISLLVGRVEDPMLASDILEECDKLILFLAKVVPFPDDMKESVLLTDLDEKLCVYRRGKKREILDRLYGLRDERLTIPEALENLSSILHDLEELSLDPQLSNVPDIYVWMIGDRSKRFGVARIRPQDVYFSPLRHCRGQYLGRHHTVYMKVPGKASHKEQHKVMACLQLKLWFGPSKYASTWDHFLEGGEMGFFAEAFENQVRAGKEWKRLEDSVGSKPLLSRLIKKKYKWKHNWSDESGATDLKHIVPPPRFQFSEVNWHVKPPSMVWVNPHAAYTTRLWEEVYEHQKKISSKDVLDSWDVENPTWFKTTDYKASIAKENIECPEGWLWLSSWRPYRCGLVDEEGFEYSIDGAFADSVEVERPFHLFRRRMWRRLRGENPVDENDDEAALNYLQSLANMIPDVGWEYASSWGRDLCEDKSFGDALRRRRWLRRIVPEENDAIEQVTYESLTDQIRQLDTSGEVPPREATRDAELALVRQETLLPRCYVEFDEAYAWQLRAYILQARDLIRSDQNHSTNAFVRVVFNTQGELTEVVRGTINPVWNQSLIFQREIICGVPQRLRVDPLPIILEVYDQVGFGKPAFLGRATILPQVRTDKDNYRLHEPPQRLIWYPISMNGENVHGAVLAAFELYQNDDNDDMLPPLPPKVDTIYQVPAAMMPHYEPVLIQFLCWGVRNLKKYRLLRVNSPMVEFQLGSYKVELGHISRLDRTPNFQSPVVTFETKIPSDPYYMTPITLCLHDIRSFGRKPLIGTCSIIDFKRYVKEVPSDFQTPVTDTENVDLESLKIKLPEIKDEDKIASQSEPNIDWWSKYYASSGEYGKCKGYFEKGLAPIKLYSYPLEGVEPFNGFEDFCETMIFKRTKKAKVTDIEDSEEVGQLKGRFHIFYKPDDRVKNYLQTVFRLPFSGPEDCVVRVYVIKATQLSSMNRSGKANPYVAIKCGSRKVSGRKKYISSTLDPNFGQMYELEVNIPQQKDLIVKIRDKNTILADDDIGETRIDLENRLLSGWRGTCGLAPQFCQSGPNVWRDQKLPLEILLDYCELYNLRRPVFESDSKVTCESVNGQKKITLSLSDIERPQDVALNPHLGDEKNRLALALLHCLRLVPEHVETRPLHTKQNAKVEHGKLHLWVDIFPKSLGHIPPPVDISLRTPTPQQLRLVIWCTRDVTRERTVLGEKFVDIVLKCWIQGLHKKAQSTDVHYHSTDGDGNFNYRIILNFDFLPSEQCVMLKEKEKFWHLKKRVEEKVAPELIVQMWDNNKFKSNEFLGQLTMNLLDFEAPQADRHHMANVSEPVRKSPVKRAYRRTARCCRSCWNCCCCKRKEEETIIRYYVRDMVPRISIVDYPLNRGWYPLLRQSKDGTETHVTGKLEMEYHMLTREEADEDKVGKGRSKPNRNPYLDRPDRPFLDRFWITSRIKAIAIFLWTRYKWRIFLILLIVGLIAFVAVWFYKMPDMVAASAK